MFLQVILPSLRKKVSCKMHHIGGRHKGMYHQSASAHMLMDRWHNNWMPSSQAISCILWTQLIVLDSLTLINTLWVVCTLRKSGQLLIVMFYNLYSVVYVCIYVYVMHMYFDILLPLSYLSFIGNGIGGLIFRLGINASSELPPTLWDWTKMQTMQDLLDDNQSINKTFWTRYSIRSVGISRQSCVLGF